MAYEFEITDVVKRDVQGKAFWTYTIRETDVSAVDEFELPVELKTPAVLTLYEAEITDAGGSGATTLQPEVGIGSGFPTSGIRHIATTAAAAATIRTQNTKPLIPALKRTPGQRVRGRSMPDADNVDVITSRLTFRLGD